MPLFTGLFRRQPKTINATFIADFICKGLMTLPTIKHLRPVLQFHHYGNPQPIPALQKSKMSDGFPYCSPSVSQEIYKNYLYTRIGEAITQLQGISTGENMNLKDAAPEYQAAPLMILLLLADDIEKYVVSLSQSAKQLGNNLLRELSELIKTTSSRFRGVLSKPEFLTIENKNPQDIFAALKKAVAISKPDQTANDLRRGDKVYVNNQMLTVEQREILRERYDSGDLVTTSKLIKDFFKSRGLDDKKSNFLCDSLNQKGLRWLVDDIVMDVFVQSGSTCFIKERDFVVHVTGNCQSNTLIFQYTGTFDYTVIGDTENKLLDAVHLEFTVELFWPTSTHPLPLIKFIDIDYRVKDILLSTGIPLRHLVQKILPKDSYIGLIQQQFLDGGI